MLLEKPSHGQNILALLFFTLLLIIRMSDPSVFYLLLVFSCFFLSPVQQFGSKSKETCQNFACGMRMERCPTAIMATDVAGYSRLIKAGEEKEHPW